MDWDILLADQLLPPSGEKRRSFSTSTPFVQAPEHKLRSLSVSFSSCSQNDSGLGVSLTEVSVASLTDNADSYPTITVSVCQTPTPYGEIPSFSGHRFELCVSPVSTKRFPYRRLETNLNSRKSFLACRSLDSDFSSDESHDLCDKTLNSDESGSSRLVDTSFARRLNLDLDIYDNNESLSEQSMQSLSTHKESQLASQFDEILKKFSPAEIDRLIGRKMGLERVDILTELHERNIIYLSTIMSYLEPEDLCRMCTVSRQWKSMCTSDKLADQRRRKFLRSRHERRGKVGKENSGKSVTPQTRTGKMTFRRLPVTLTQQCEDVPKSRKVKTTTEQFIAAASGLKNDERLQKCPRCRKPAKVLPIQDRGKCQNPDCSFNYCTSCLSEFHGSKECTPKDIKKTKTDAIGTRKSKKNLKRL